MSISLDEVPAAARTAWLHLSDDLREIVGSDLVAMWAYGGTTSPDPPRQIGDLDTHVVVARPPDGEAVQSIEEAQRTIADKLGVEWDNWYILAEDARRAESPPHVFR